MKKRVLAILVVASMLFGMSGCTNTTKDSEEQVTNVQTDEKTETKTDAILINEAEKTIEIQAVSTGKTDSSIHLLVNEDGSNAESSYFTTKVSTKELYDAIVQLGGVPGNNIKLDAADGTILGSGLNVTISVDENDYDVYDLIEASETRDVDMRFGGNVQLNQEYATGCLMCMESCSLGIVSDAAYEYCEEMEFIPNDNMPEEGTEVTFTIEVDDTAIVVDEENGIIAMNVTSTGYAESTIHAIVNEDGGNADKTLFTTPALTKDFYEALKELGAIDGNNISLEDKDGIIEGTDLDVTVENDGVTMSFAELFTASETRDMQMRFGGNIEVNQDLATGCVMCLESCPAGITSNAAYQFQEAITFAPSDKMPEKGTHIIVKFAVMK